ncbi:IS3 family transposase [Aeoliella mucimassa]|uniref:Integrase core domain protein n=1 Tax=Aeoliella mucimassa TaxID=2527972 RepID=A0A518AIU6_9BACT|nr:IS3 family transposase [Aeoliella mucimassa]QDU54651.1 Integrase core domain protein [Aeoliella mucimassa]QDU55663.1 Integrase core domain protein [Aeoliella mucimassa]QDU57545.1 Integrase core domain protein [Aeoliella mucimassa]QDU58539.1 Integrase core domain protein [Aeoliella mucimassa]
MKYAWISEHRDSFPVALMCQLLQVSRSGYYDSVDRPRSKRSERTAKIHESVRQVFEASDTIYGPQKIAHELQQHEELETACRNTVASAMKEMGLKSRVRKRFTPTTTKADPSKQQAPNVLDRDFDAERPNQKWVTDITYLPTLAGWVYVAVVVDLFSRKVVGWSMSHSLATPLVSDALRQAIESRQPRTGELLHHSDRGCQYTSESYQRTLQTLGIECSMSRRGNCYDNAVAERFFWSLKHEWTKHYEYADLESARLSVFKYIDMFYNRQRLHPSLGYTPPEAFETDYAPTVAA